MAHDRERSVPMIDGRPTPTAVSLFSGAALRALRRTERGPKVRGYISPSDAGKCARQIAYKTLGAAKDPNTELSPSSVWSMGMGNVIEDVITAQLAAEFGDAFATQVRVDETVSTKYGPLRIFGYADIVLKLFGKFVVDIKSTANYGYRAKVFGLAWKGAPPEGPSDEHMLQVAMYAVLLYADMCGIGYITRDPVSVKDAGTEWANGFDPEKMVCADYIVPVDDVIDFVSAEVDRLGGIMNRCVAEGMLPKRIVPGCAEIYRWDTAGAGWWRNRDGKDVEEWSCRYCPFRERCDNDGQGVVPFVTQSGDATHTEQNGDSDGV